MLPEPSSHTRLVLFTKSFGAQGFKHKSGYAKYGNPPRWHKVGHDNPAPKGAPVAHSPDAAGAHLPVQLLPEQIEKLKYPAEKAAANSEMAAFNDKHLQSLLAHAEAGDATAILGHGFGTNTHSLKKVAIANFLLSQMGSEHKVSPGQKAGEHAAVQAAEAAASAAPALFPKGSAWSYVVEGAFLAHQKGDVDALADFEAEAKVAVSYHGKKALAYIHQLQGKAAPEPAPPAQAKTGHLTPSGPFSATLYHGTSHDFDTYDDSHAGKTTDDGWYGVGMSMSPNKALAEQYAKFSSSQTGKPGKVIEKQVSLKNPLYTKTGGMEFADAFKDATGKNPGTPKEITEDLKAAGFDGVVALKDDGSLSEVTVFTATTPQPTVPLTMPDFQEGKTKTGVKAYYDKKAASIATLAQAGDVTGLKAMPTDKGNSWAGKTPNSKKLMALHAAAVAQAEDVLLQDVTQPTAQAQAQSQNPVKNAEPSGSKVSEPTEVASPAPIKKEPRLVLPKAPAVSQPKPEASPAPQAAAITPQSGMPDWDAAMLPDTNSNAKSHNGIVTKIKAAAESGDVDALVAIIDAKYGAKQTYAKKQLALAQAAMGALQSAAPVGDKEGSGQAEDAEKPQLISGIDEAIALEKQIKPGPSAAVEEINNALFSNYDDKFVLKDASGKVTAAIAFGVNEGPGGDSIEVHHIGSVDKGGGSKLLALAKDAAKKHGIPIKLYAVKEAVGFYEKQGFAHVGAATTSDGGSLMQWKDGPKEGDTKPGADGGMLVFKDGRWHKQAAPAAVEPAAPAPAPAPKIKALKPAEAIKIMASIKTAPGNKAKFKAMAVAGDAAGLQDWIDNESKKFPASKLVAGKLLSAMTSGAEDLPLPTPKPKAAPATAPAATNAPPSMDAWTQTGPQGGSNPGGRFKDESGQEWYCKFPGDPETAKSEVLASRLYAAAGLAGQDAMLVTKDGKIGIASKWASVSNAGGPAILAKVDGARSGFAVDAWLANWDVVGLGYDNLQIGPDGKAVRIDAGGSLEYRAQGSKKPFGPKVDEIDSLRDKSKNPQAAAVFGGMTDADITASAAKVAAITPAQIRALVADHGPGDKAAQKALADTLIARRDDLLARFPKADKKTAKKRLDPAALPVDPSVLPKPHDFNNWSDTGKPLSSKQHLNDANLNVEHEMLAVAKQGNLPKLQAFEFHVLDKDTGLPTGATKPISQHPSKHVVQFHSDLVQTLDEIANPPQPLKIFRETDVGSLAALDAAFPPKPFGTTVSKVSSTEKLGFWVALGAVSEGAVQKIKPKASSDYSTAAVAKAKAKFAGASALAKHFIQRIQQSGSYNDLFRDGKEYDNDGNKLADVAKAALAHATEMPEGTTLYRYQKMTPAMIDHIMAAKDGTVFQATGPMCTSYHPTATSGFAPHRIVIRYAKGAKAVESFASGKYVGEKEVTTLPNARFVILSKTKKPGGNLDLELLMLPPDIGL